MKYSLRSKLSLSYVFVTFLLVASISLFMNFLLENQFKGYVIKQQKQRISEIVSLVGKQFNDEKNSFNKNAFENIGVNALEQGIILKVKDEAGKMLWDATVHNNGFCVQMLDHMSHNTNSHYANFKGGYVENKYPVSVNFKEVGSIEVGYYGPFYFTGNDLAFINSLNNILIFAGIFSLFFALILGSFMARRISRPISRAVAAASEISRGNYRERISEPSNTKEIIKLTGTINDLAQTLETQENLRKRMAQDVAHELRTPLTTLQSHMEAMIDGIWEIDINRLKSCHEEIIRINKMVGDMERLSKYEAENNTLNKIKFDISTVLQNIINNFESEFKSKDIKLNFRGENEIIFADKDKISQVLINIISNALKYTPKGGEVEIKNTISATETLICIRDNGNGIPPEDLPYIFERFYRADKSRNRLTGGSGIGLTIAKVIVEAHKGRIMVNSEINKGTEFIISLPKE